MTPFGLFLESIRRNRHLHQVQLADRLGVNSCYVSAIENGKKGPPSKPILEKLISELNLDAQEQELLWDYVDQSQRTIRLPEDATPEEYTLMRDIRRHLGALSIEQIDIIRNTLKLSGQAQTKPRIEVRSI
jgi:transcriptional regulator with XRE-family HTH domain|tara:strand:+ start:3498 stop:3890 length:393 start_codon:yes stop_codon:yes gene_type:complete